MYRIRPISAQDFEGFKQIAIASGPGFTSLPVDDTRLRQKIERSEQSFGSNVARPGDESYLFILERLHDDAQDVRVGAEARGEAHAAVEGPAR